MEEVKKEAAEFMKIRAVWQFFEAEAEGDSLHLFAPGSDNAVAHVSIWEGQRQGDFLCLADYVLPAQNGQRDHLALFVVTAGEGIRGRSEKEKNEGYYFSPTVCRHWQSRRRKRARNGCTGVSERIGDSPIHRR